MKTNEEILSERTERFNKRKGIRIGDFLKLSNGIYLRFSHDCGKKIQTSEENGNSSFYLGDSGCDFSGGLYTTIEKSMIKKIDETREGNIWFFKNNYRTAHNRINFNILFMVYELTDKNFEKNYINTWLSN